MNSPHPSGNLVTNEQIDVYKLENASGCCVSVLTLGGIIASLVVPDRDGNMEDVVLGLPSLEAYLTNPPYFGAIIGRVAGRIPNAQFLLDGQIYHLPANDGTNHLHGGIRGFDKRLWNATPVPREDGSSAVKLERTSMDGEEGYPGNVKVSVTYTLTPENALVIESEAVSDRATPFSLTHHSYFNLAGESRGQTIEDHVLQIAADSFAPADAAMIHRGRRGPVTPCNDFRKPRRIGDAIPEIHQGHGDLYFLEKPENNSPRFAALLTHPGSGRALTVATTEDCLQLYTGASLDASLIGKSGRPYPGYGGVCLECQGYPDGVSNPSLGDIVLRPGQHHRKTTTYTFSTIS